MFAVEIMLLLPASNKNISELSSQILSE